MVLSQNVEKHCGQIVCHSWYLNRNWTEALSECDRPLGRESPAHSRPSGKEFSQSRLAWRTQPSCQQTLPVNQRKRRIRKWKRGVRPQPWGLSLHPRDASLQTGENTRRAKTCGMWRILARMTASASVNKTGDLSWGGKVVAPQKPWFPTTSPLRKSLSLYDPDFPA
jgi:hypothetical protein